MFQRRLLLIFLTALLCQGLFPQQKYWVSFKDKPGVAFNPYHYFDARTIEKRIRLGIPLVMETDLPLNADYLGQVNKIASVSSESRWLNAVAVGLSDSQLRAVKELPCVIDVTPVETFPVRAGSKNVMKRTDYDVATIRKQTDVMGGELFSAGGIDGAGVRIAVLDAGFPGVDTLPEFRHLRNEGRIIDTWDFVKNRRNVFAYNSHGTGVLCCIAGDLDSLKTGLGTGAEFLLARTEVEAEIFSEEENWFAAIEWADKNGADIINSSLGYTFNRYFPQQMDGKSTYVSRMANVAAGKGLLVINAAGNDGDNDWEVIGAPADADSVLTVGGIDSETGIHIGFSSYGPTYDGRLKPNVSAFGDVYTAGKHGELKYEYGTSFAAPLVTGFAACVMQMHPDWDNMKVFSEIEKSGHLFPYYDYAHGYGIPQASYFFGAVKGQTPTFSMSREPTGLTITLSQFHQETGRITDSGKDGLVGNSSGNGKKWILLNNDTIAIVKHNNHELFEHFPQEHFYIPDDNYLYYHFADRNSGKVRYYAVVDMEDAGSYSIDLDDMKNDEILKIYFRGYTQSFSQ